jgi:ABC-2 type transport system permease protein
MNILVRKLILKELYLNRWLLAGTALAACLCAGICTLGTVGFNIGAIGWLTAIIAAGVMLAIYGVGQERKEHSLEFVLSLPISPRQYVLAKMLGLLLAFLLPWAVALAAAIALVTLSAHIADGMLVYVLLLGGFLLANFGVVLCGALSTRSEGAMTAVIITTNMGVSIFIFLVGALPDIRNHLEAPSPVWNSTVIAVLLIEALVLAATLALPLLTTARRRDFF